MRLDTIRLLETVRLITIRLLEAIGLEAVGLESCRLLSKLLRLLLLLVPIDRRWIESSPLRLQGWWQEAVDARLLGLHWLEARGLGLELLSRRIGEGTAGHLATHELLLLTVKACLLIAHRRRLLVASLLRVQVAGLLRVHLLHSALLVQFCQTLA